jgi:hypothetical protein
MAVVEFNQRPSAGDGFLTEIICMSSERRTKAKRRDNYKEWPEKFPEDLSSQ